MPAALDGLDVAMLGRGALITNKRASGRTRGRADIAELERRAPSP